MLQHNYLVHGIGGGSRGAGGGGGICPHKHDLVGALPPQRSAAGHVNLTQQLSPCSMGQHGTVALVGFKVIV